MNFTIADLLSVAHSKAIGFEKLQPKSRFAAICTDSRLVKKNDLFIALRGEQFDGHSFLLSVKKNGAIAAVVDKKWYQKNKTSLPKKLALFVVEDTLFSYGALASVYRRKFTLPILLVAGSNGKTTSKDVISSVLSRTFNVLKTEANYNNHIGLPKMLFQLRPSHKIAVLEIGTNHPGEIKRLAEIAEATHGIITNIGNEHLEFFKNIKGVAQEELALFDDLKVRGAFAFINLDDPYFKNHPKQFKHRCATFSTRYAATVNATSLGLNVKGKNKIRLTTAKKTVELQTSLIAGYAPSLIAAATAVGLHFGVSMLNIKRTLQSYKPHSKRMEMVKLSNGVLVINDTYNANPESFDAALETLDRIPSRGKKYVAAGDMFELGAKTNAEHSALGKRMASYRFDGYFFTGKAMQQASNSLARTNKKTFILQAEKKDIARILIQRMRRGDIILLKGSRGMKMEQILEQLRIMNTNEVS